jgi:alkylation response protein AidB-like acyl-CoA dehydrogenase
MPETIGTERDEILATIREFVDLDVLPTASRYDHADEFPADLVETMRGLGLFGVTIPEGYGGLGLDLETYALIVIELSRGWISLSGVLNTHFISAHMIEAFGTGEQKQRLLPRMAAGELRAAFSMTEPHAGSDVQAIRTRARCEGEEYVIDGQKMWVTNGLRAGIVMLLAVTDPDARPRHRGMTAFVIEKEPGQASLPGLEISAPLPKLGYKGVESVELVFDGFRTPVASVLGGQENEGFKQFMAGIEVGRVNVAARGVGVAKAGFEAAIATPSSGTRSASRSRSIRRSSSSWRRWRRRSVRPSCSSSTRRAARTPASGPTSRPAWRNSSRRRRRRRWRSSRCASTAATATRSSTLSSGSTATPRSSSSARGRTRSSS